MDVPLSAAGIRGDNHSIFPVVNVGVNPVDHSRLGVQVVDRNIEKTLNETTMSDSWQQPVT